MTKTERQNIVNEWFADLLSEPSSLAELRKARSIEDVYLTKAFHQINGRLSGVNSAWLAAAVGCLVAVKRNQRGCVLGDAMAQPGNTGGPRVSEVRFKGLMRTRTPETLFTRLRMLMPMFSDGIDINDVFESILNWGDDTKRRLCESYYLATLQAV